MNFQYLKLEIFIPETHLKILQSTLQSVDAGHFGNYDSCLAYSRVTGTWRPLDGTNPYIGEHGKVSEESEIKVEVNIYASRLDETINAIKNIHPYEEPLINVIPLYNLSL